MPYQVIKNNLNTHFKGFLFWNRQVGALRFGLKAVNSGIPAYNEGSVPPKNRSWSKTLLSEVLFTGHQAGPVSSKAFNNISN